MKRIAAFALAVACSVSSQATIVDNGNSTYDSETGLSWLDVLETVEMSYNDVIAEMGVGGRFEGWRHATTDEWDTLIKHFNYVPVTTGCDYGVLYCDDGAVSDAELIEDMIRMLGDTYAYYFSAYGPTPPAEPDAVQPDGAGHTFGLLVYGVEPRLVDAGYGILHRLPPTIARSYLGDEEILLRRLGFPMDEKDRPDAVKTLSGPLGYAPDRRSVLGHYLVRCEGVTRTSDPYYCAVGTRTVTPEEILLAGIWYYRGAFPFKLELILEPLNANQEKLAEDEAAQSQITGYRWRFSLPNDNKLSERFTSLQQALDYLKASDIQYHLREDWQSLLPY